MGTKPDTNEPPEKDPSLKTDEPIPMSATPFADYEAERERLAKGADEEPEKEPDKDPDNPPKEDPKKTPTGAENPGDDGDDDAGEKSAKKRPEDLDPWVQKRLDREKRKTERERARADSLEARIAALETGKTDPKATDEGKPESKKATAVSDDPIPEEEYDYDFPEEGDYKSEAEWIEDIDRWDRNLALKGGKHAKAKTDDTKKADQPPDTGTQNQDEQLRVLFEDVRETLEESDDAADDLSEKFFEQLQSNRFAITREMLDWLADNDDAVAVAAEFVRSPRVANRIARRPNSSHGELLDKLAADLKGKAAKKPETDKRKANDNKAPVVSALRASRNRPVENINKADVAFKDYEAQRMQMGAGRR